MKVKRVSNISSTEFLEEYLIGNKPVIVTDAMKDWDVKKFTPTYLKEDFGDAFVQTYNDFFDLQNVGTLAEYFENNFDREVNTNEYVRWYSQLLEADFFWSNDCFTELAKSWTHPYFAPKNDLVFPLSMEDASKDITKELYPYKGVFISGKGGRTRLHRDPFNTNALLCQFFGSKKIYLFHPDKEKDVMKDGEYVDMANVDTEKFPNFSSVTPDYEDELQPGEIILFPSGWFHDVTSQSDSVSITWNFTHKSGLDGFLKHLEENPEDDQMQVLRYFLKDKVSETATNEEIIELYDVYK